MELRTPIAWRVSAWVLPIVALAAILWIPSLVPVKNIVSDSYMFGYNNRIGEALLLLFTPIIGGVWYVAFQTFPPDGATDNSPRIPLSILAIAIAAVLAMCGGLLMLTYSLNGFGESMYMIDRLTLLTYGKLPYRDFDYLYGPLFLYGPLILHSVFHIGIAGGYYVFWVLNWVGGIYLLYATINLVDSPTSYRARIFIALCIFSPCIVITEGLNYTFLRFTASCYCAMLVYHSRKSSNGSLTDDVKVVALSSSLLLLLLALSPETGIAFALATIFFDLINRDQPGRLRPGLLFLLFFLFSAEIFLANFMGELNALKGFSGGGYSFPIIPAAHILMYVFSIFFCGFILFTRYRLHSLDSGIVYLIFVGILALPAALGRCDPGHVFLNGLGIYIPALFVASRDTRIWRWYYPAFLVFVIALPVLSGLFLYRNMVKGAILNIVFIREIEGKWNPLDRIVSKAISAQHQDQKAAERRGAIRLLREHPIGDISFYYPGSTSVLDAPFGFAPEGLGDIHSSQIDTGRYHGLEDVFSSAQIDQKIWELAMSKDRNLILPRTFKESCEYRPEPEAHLISTLLMFPYHPHVQHVLLTYRPLCNYITSHYEIVEPATSASLGYEIWQRRKDGPFFSGRAAAAPPDEGLRLEWRQASVRGASSR